MIVETIAILVNTSCAAFAWYLYGKFVGQSKEYERTKARLLKEDADRWIMLSTELQKQDVRHYKEEEQLRNIIRNGTPWQPSAFHPERTDDYFVLTTTDHLDIAYFDAEKEEWHQPQASGGFVREWLDGRNIKKVCEATDAK